MMSGRTQIIHLPSRYVRLFGNEVKGSCQLSKRNIHTLPNHVIRGCQTNLTSRYQSVVVPSPALCRTAMTISVEKPGKFKQFIKKMGWLDHSRSKLKRSGFILYEKVSEQVLSHDFFEVCDMPDTFNSWFLVTELHIWLLAVRMMAEGEEGRFTRNAMLEALWQDAEERSKKVGASSLSIRQEQMQSIGASFQAALFAYDEGIMSDDRVLASALWRRLFSKNCEDPERLECIVSYVRRQAALLDSLSNDDLMINCQVKWVPLLEQELS